MTDAPRSLSTLADTLERAATADLASTHARRRRHRRTAAADRCGPTDAAGAATWGYPHFGDAGWRHGAHGAAGLPSWTMDVPGIPRPVLVVLIAAAVVLLAGGASWAVALATHHTETRTRTIPATPTVEIEGERGDIVVVGRDRGDIRLITKESRSIFGRPEVKVDVRDGKLRLDGNCSEFEIWGADGGCSVNYRLEIPRDTDVRLRARSGDVSAEDLGGSADLQTSSGDVDAVGILGALRLKTSSGDVGVDASSKDIDARSTSGDVHVFARDATRVRAQTSSGDVHVSVPDRTYAVHTRADSGDEHIDVSQNADAPRRIDASTTSGDVHVEPDG
jgi:hypothetical protein